MTNKEILQKAIERAEDNGWERKYNHSAIYDMSPVEYYAVGFYIDIFSHKFAKAFWGKRLCCPECGEIEELYGGLKPTLNCGKCESFFEPEERKILWKFHLQRMILEEEPLKYIEKYL